MKKKKITQYTLIKDYHVSAGQLSRLRKNSYVSTHTIEMLCDILDCSVEDIMTFTKSPSSRNIKEEGNDLPHKEKDQI